MSQRPDVDALIYRSALLLDERDFAGYVALLAEDFRYLITAHSPEIRREMTWLDHDRAGLQTLLETLPRHHSDPSPLTRHVTVYAVTVAEDGAEAQAVSALQVFRTTLDGGATALFAVGKIHDRVALGADGPRLRHRHIKLDTRMLGIGTHLPF